jgi:hypothetical protein
MKTIWDPSLRSELLSRFEKLTTDRRPAWGSMTAGQMIAHVADPMKAALGEMTVAMKPGLFSNPIVRHFIIYWSPWPKGAPTAPEFLHSHPEDLEAGLAALRETLERFVAARKDASRKPHPAFGLLSGRAWGRLMYRHLDHHLRQFKI